MKNLKTNNVSVFAKFKTLLLIVALSCFNSCDDNELPEAGSIPDLTPPSAQFSASQGEGAGDEWKTVFFSNQSNSATSYSWDFGDGNMSTDFEPSNEYSGEGTYTVTLVARDNLGVESTFTDTVEVTQPPAPTVPDPTLINPDFDKLPKSSGSDCSCSAWINKSLGDQGESSSGNGGSDNVVKFDNNEPDHVYQEFEVVPNADYTISVVVSFKSLVNNTPPMDAMFEIRVLAGSGYVNGYTPAYFTDSASYPQDDFGYTTIAQVEDAANNLLTETISNPSDDSYITYTYTFNAGNNTSVALFMRGIGGAATGNFGYNSGDEEIRADSVVITAN